MKYNLNGKFKIMQITDIQEIPNISRDTLDLIESAVSSEKPDLVVLTGDQIKGYGMSYGKNGDKQKEVFDVINRLLASIVKHNIPYAVTFGNHDRQVGLSNREQLENIYKKIGNCVGNQADELDSAGTCYIPIYSSDGRKIKNNIYLFDSGTDAKGGGYEPFDTRIIDWYRNKRDDLKNETGNFVPSIVFQHIPMDEYYKVLKRVGKFTKHAVRAYRKHKNEYYVLGDSCKSGDIFLEPPSVPNENTGEFDALNECGDVMAVFVGHDHKNSFVGRYKNIDLGFTQSCGFNCYGNRSNRGVRIIELDENKPNEYKTYTRTFREIVNRRVARPVFDYVSFIAPETTDAAVTLILRTLLVVAVIILLFVVFL